MKHTCQKWICLMLCITLSLPLNLVVAAGKTAGKSPYNEVILGDTQSFNGRLVNNQGIGIDGAVVKLTQSGKEVAQTVTSKDGSFKVNNLKAGNYLVSAGDNAALVRLWEKSLAPPKAKENTLLVNGGGKVVRGQLGGLDVITIVLVALLATDLGFTIANRNDINDLEDRLKKIEAALATP